MWHLCVLYKNLQPKRVFLFFMSLEFCVLLDTFRRTYKTYLQIYVHKASELWNFYRALYRQQCVFMLFEICIAVFPLNWCSPKTILNHFYYVLIDRLHVYNPVEFLKSNIFKSRISEWEDENKFSNLTEINRSPVPLTTLKAIGVISNRQYPVSSGAVSVWT